MATGDNARVTELEGQVTDLEAQLEGLTKKLEALTKGDDNAAKVTELTGQIDEVTSALEQTTDALERVTVEKSRLEAISKLPPKEQEIAKAYDAEDKADGGADEDEEDSSGKKKKKLFGKRLAKFMELTPEARAAQVADLEKKDETVTLEGQVIRKSVVGDSLFTVMKAQAEKITKNEKDIYDANERTLKAELKKRADDEYKHVPGTADERADMLAAIEKMADPLKKAFLAVLTQSEKLGKAGFDKLGQGGGADPSKETEIKKAAQTFDTKVAEIKKRDSCTNTQALAKARKEHPDLFKAYQGQEKQEGTAQQ